MGVIGGVLFGGVVLLLLLLLLIGGAILYMMRGNSGRMAGRVTRMRAETAADAVVLDFQNIYEGGEEHVKSPECMAQVILDGRVDK
jgi:hypothetical protein